MSNFTRSVDFTRVCVDCGHHAGPTARKEHHMCRLPVDIVTGAPHPQRCLVMRGMDGACGPKGRFFSAAANIVKFPVAAE